VIYDNIEIDDIIELREQIQEDILTRFDYLEDGELGVLCNIVTENIEKIIYKRDPTPKPKVFTFGKYRGIVINKVIITNPKYCEWVRGNVKSFQFTKEEEILLDKELEVQDSRDYYNVAEDYEHITSETITRDGMTGADIMTIKYSNGYVSTHVHRMNDGNDEDERMFM